jgi:hypothetical protein
MEERKPVKIYNARSSQTVASKSVEQNSGSKLGNAKNRFVQE